MFKQGDYVERAGDEHNPTYRGTVIHDPGGRQEIKIRRSDGVECSAPRGRVSPVLDAPKGEEPDFTRLAPESWHGFRRGERVRTKYGATGTVTGEQSGYLLVMRDDGLKGGGPNGEIGQYANQLERLAPPQPLGDGDRLFESGCCLCGAKTFKPGITTPLGRLGQTRKNAGRSICFACLGNVSNEEGWARADEEVTRRKQLAEKSAAMAQTFTTTCKACQVGEGVHEEDCERAPRYPNTGFVPYDERVGLQSLSEPKPDDGPAYVNANWPEDSEYWGQG